MARWCGNVGFGITEETKPGVYESVIHDRTYYGDMMRDTVKRSAPSKVNDDLDVNNQISILADAFAYDHFHTIQYVELYGVRWKVSSVEVQRPRLILSIGGVYNGPAPRITRKVM